MTVYNNTFEGLTDGQAVATGGAGGASGTAVANVQGANWKGDSTAAIDGSMGLSNILASSGTVYTRWDDPTASGRGGVRVKWKHPGNPPATATLCSLRYDNGTTDVGVVAMQILSTGIPQIIRQNGGVAITGSRPSTALPAGDLVCELLYTPGATAAQGRIHWRIEKQDGTVLHTWDDGTDYDIGATGAMNKVRVGLMLSTQWADAKFKMDSIRWGSLASGWFGNLSTPPTIIVTTNGMYYVLDVRSSTGTTTPTYTIAWTSGPNNAASIIESIDGLFFIPVDADTASTYTVTAATGGNTSQYIVTVPPSAPATDVGLESLVYQGGIWV